MIQSTQSYDTDKMDLKSCWNLGWGSLLRWTVMWRGYMEATGVLVKVLFLSPRVDCLVVLLIFMYAYVRK